MKYFISLQIGKTFKQQQQAYQKKQQKIEQHQQQNTQDLEQERQFLKNFCGPMDKNFIAHQKFKPDQFRFVDSLYEDLYYKQLSAYKSVHDGYENIHNKYTIGYVENIPQYPGTKMPIMHPFHSRCLGKFIKSKQDYIMLNQPIITIRDQEDLDSFVSLFMPDEDGLNQFKQQLNEEKEIWFLPDTRVLFCIRYTDNIQDAVLQNQSKEKLQEVKQEIQGDKDKQQQTKKITVDELYNKIKKIFILICIVILVVVTGYIYISSKYLNNQMGGTNIRKLYQTLNISETASRKDVQKAFRNLSIKYHPDRNPNCKDCYEKFQKINNAYQKIIKIMDIQEGKHDIN